MFTTTDLFFLGVIILALVALGVVITIGNERVRRATLGVRDVARSYAQQDLRMRRESAAREIQIVSKEEANRTVSQVVLDVTGEAPTLSEVTLLPGPVMAIRCLDMSGSEFVLTPSAKAFVESDVQMSQRAGRSWRVDGLVSGEFVVVELAAVARHLGATALPRSEEWMLFEIATTRADALRVRRGNLLNMLRPA